MAIESYTVNLDQGAPGPQHAWAMSLGADCARCNLRNTGRGPVPPTLPNEIDILIVGEAPGHTEIECGAVLTGASGKEVRRALAAAGAPIARVGLTNACLCAPTVDMKKYLQQCKKKGEPSAIELCRPRLLREVQRAKFVILMGSASLTAVGIPKSSIMAVRGSPLQLADGRPALATPHAAFVMRDDGARYRPVFHADIAKATRLAYTGSTWRDPWYFTPKTATEIANFLAVDRPRVAVDVETDGIDRWACGLRRVGIGTDKEVLIYSPLSVKGHALMPANEIQASTRAIADFFQRANTNTHNGTAFDQVVLNRYGMALNEERSFDGLVGHQVGVTSELPHRLDFLASIYCDSPVWKPDVKHSNVVSDEALDKYLSFDIATTFVSSAYVQHNLVTTNQQHVYAIDSQLFKVGRAMAALGIYIDPAKRLEFAVEYQKKSIHLRQEFVEAAGRDINPGSPVQIRKLLYETLGLPILEDHITDSDEPSTDENTLLDLLSLGVDKRAEKIIHGIIGYREAEKILGTNTGHIVNGMLEGGPPVHGDGRLRTTWRPGKTSGRWGCSDPVNLQNIGKKLREMYVAQNGNVFVAADMSAVELRKVAELAGDKPLIDAFALFDAKLGPDVHVANACGLFRCAPEQVNDEVRRFVKNFVYALTYAAEPPKIYQTLSLLRDDNLRPLFPSITLAEIERVFALYWKLHPAVPDWRKKIAYLWRSQRFLETQIHKRKRYFIAGESPTEFPAFMVSGSCADMQNDAIMRCAQAYPFDFVNHRGVVLNGHDQIVIECAEREANDVKELLKQTMQKSSGGVLYPAEPKVGKTWKEVS